MARTCPDGHLSTSTDYCDVCGLALEPEGSASGSGGSGVDDETSPDLSPIGPVTQDCPNCSAQNPPDALFCEACGYDYTTGTMPRPVEPLTFPLPGSFGGAGSAHSGAASVDSGAAAADSAAAVAGQDGTGTDDEEPADEELDVEGPDDGEQDVEEQGAGPDGSTQSGLSDADAADDDEADADANPAPALPEPWVAEVWIDPDWYSEQGSWDRMPSPGLPTIVLLRHTSSLIGRASRSRGIAPDIDISGDPGVSRRHAQLTTDGSRWFVEDLGSANGTFVGATSQALPQESLATGDRREIGSGEQIYLGAWTRLVIRKAADGEV